ncbi:MAG: hypothetical protein PHY14_03255 [Candidatus Gracilibacteria bacterium]|nr:hypothetical protein [Candidatus Gracilibacteria bacterium]
MDNNYQSIRRHGVLLFFMISKFIFFLIPLGLLIWIFAQYRGVFPADFSNFIVLPILLLTINYIFLQLILNAIDYYGRIMLVGDHSIIFIHTSLLLVDDIEFMDMKSIIKVDVERHGIIANILNYGHLILEQRNDVRKVHYIPHAHSIYQVIKNRIPKRQEIENII